MTRESQEKTEAIACLGPKHLIGKTIKAAYTDGFYAYFRLDDDSVIKIKDTKDLIFLKPPTHSLPPIILFFLDFIPTKEYKKRVAEQAAKEKEEKREKELEMLKYLKEKYPDA